MPRIYAQTPIATAALLFFAIPSSASAHYLWVTINSSDGTHATTNIYFEGSPAPGDGHYLDPFVKTGKTWLRTVEAPQAKQLETKAVTKPGKRWLAAKLPETKRCGVESYGLFGVYAYGQTNVLLHYYARTLEVDTAADLKVLARAEQLDLDIVPQQDNDAIVLKVLWKGEPQAKVPLYIRGPKGFKQNTHTDTEWYGASSDNGGGHLHIPNDAKGKKSGSHNDEDYSEIRRHATLKMRLPIAK